MIDQELSNRFKNIKPTRVSLVDSSSRQLASSIRARNAAEIRLTDAPAALTGLEVKNIDTNVPDILKTPATPIPTNTNPEKQSAGTEQTEEEKQKQVNLEQKMNSTALRGEAQTEAHRYNQQVIQQTHIALDEQMINAMKLQADALKMINAKLNEVVASQNSKEPSIVTP